MTEESNSPDPRPGKAKVLPFAQVPYDLLKDPRLKPIDKVIAGLLLEWLHRRDSGWVLNDILIKNSGASLRTVQYSLRQLEKCGWYRCDRVPDNVGRRRIVALWRSGERHETEEDATVCTLAMQGVAPSGVQGIAPKEESGTKNQEKDLLLEVLSGSASGCAPTVGGTEITLSPSGGGATAGARTEQQPEGLEDDPTAVVQRARLRGILEGLNAPTLKGRKRSAAVTSAAGILARLLMDEENRKFHLLLCWRVAWGQVPAAKVLEHLGRACDEVGSRGINNPASYFVGCIKNTRADLAWEDEVEPEVREQAQSNLQAAIAKRGRAG
jgi:hypothetical protein